MDKRFEKYKCFAAQSKDNDVLAKSSSGGVFTHLCNYIINTNGKVYSPIFDDSFNSVYHAYTSDNNFQKHMIGSKYIMSRMNTILSSIKSDLETGLNVLFSGTPCQVAALKKYLNNKNYTNLYLQDVVCHGAPQPVLWSKYSLYLKEKYKSNISAVNFRDKRYGWKNYCVAIDFSNGYKFVESAKYNKYMELFLSDICLIEACYNCKFKGDNFVSDITLGDLWGVQSSEKITDINKGVSAIIIRTKNGIELWNNISTNLISEAVDYAEITKMNSSILFSAKKHEKYNDFNNDLLSMEFSAIYNKYMPLSNFKKMKNWIKKYVIKRL